MNRGEVIELLNRGQNDPHLRQLVLSALTLIEPPAVISISDWRGRPGGDREKALDECEFRNTWAKKRGLVPRRGYEETLRSLAESKCDHVWTVLIERAGEPDIIEIIVDRNDTPVGCMIGRVTEPHDSHNA